MRHIGRIRASLSDCRQAIILQFSGAVVLVFNIAESFSLSAHRLWDLILVEVVAVLQRFRIILRIGAKTFSHHHLLILIFTAPSAQFRCQSIRDGFAAIGILSIQSAHLVPGPHRLITMGLLCGQRLSKLNDVATHIYTTQPRFTCGLTQQRKGLSLSRLQQTRGGTCDDERFL